MAQKQRRPRRSLRTILTVLFLLFSILPLAFVTYYSVVKFEKAIDHELSQRLLGNAREVGVILNDFKASLQLKRDRFLQDPTLIYHVSTGDMSAIRSLANSWIRTDLATGLAFFNRNGKMLASVAKDGRGDLKDFVSDPGSAYYLSQENIEKIKATKDYAFVEHAQSKLVLILFSKILGSGGRVIGFVEQSIDLDRAFLMRLKERMKLELLVARASGQITVSSNDDFLLYKTEFFQTKMSKSDNSFFELQMRGSPFGFILTPMSWGNSEFFLGLGASKKEAMAVLRNVNVAFFTVVGTVVVLLIGTILITSNAILRPLDDLLKAIQNVQGSDQAIEIPIRSNTEIGLLTDSFNLMSRNVSKARGELKSKINELESINKELVETQSRLVHSSKMVSLGQLVAGVAHELNNPIGFIYSNMSHLRDYAERLINLAETAQRNPEQVAQLAEEYDLTYIKQDLPKLISSCEDGARRTRDIVLGLRNFSRLEESKLKEIDINESIENTLSLLAGELRNRIQLHRNFGKIPPVRCYASQINQVLMNLLSNAAQAIEGSGNIWITTNLIRSANGSESVQISIQDSGKGIPEENLEKIFDPFFTTKGVGQGTGLGLSISYGIVQSHGGQIAVKSQAGIGTEFVVTIPLDGEVLRESF